MTLTHKKLRNKSKVHSFFLILILDDKIDDFINKNENKNWWRTIKDELNNKDVILTDE